MGVRRKSERGSVSEKGVCVNLKNIRVCVMYLFFSFPTPVRLCFQHVEHGQATMPQKKQPNRPSSGGCSRGSKAPFAEEPLPKVCCLSWSQCCVLCQPAVQGGSLRYEQRARDRKAPPPPCGSAGGEIGAREGLCGNAEREAWAVARPAND